MGNAVTKSGIIAGIRGLRGVWKLPRKRDYVARRNVRPRRAAARRAAVGVDPLEQRAASVTGSILERIVFKRLELLVGPANIGFIYKFQLGAVGGTDARVFLGGFELDFVILNRPSAKQMALEILGAHWHGPVDFYKDQARALSVLGVGYDYAEIEEWEIMLGDDYLDDRLSYLIGLPSRQSVQERTDIREVKEINAVTSLD